MLNCVPFTLCSLKTELSQIIQDKLIKSTYLFFLLYFSFFMNWEQDQAEEQIRVWEHRDLVGCGVWIGGLEEINCVWTRQKEEKAAWFQLWVCVFRRAWVNSCDSKRSETESRPWVGSLGGWGWCRRPVGHDWWRGGGPVGSLKHGETVQVCEGRINVSQQQRGGVWRINTGRRRCGGEIPLFSCNRCMRKGRID